MGAKQNRIVNTTILVKGNGTMVITLNILLVSLGMMSAIIPF